jgi:secreted PhoX family phosphatase
MMHRRSLLRGALAALPLAALWRRTARAASYGPLVPDPDGVLDLPEGFTYRIVEQAGAAMTDGYRVPGLPDGMGCFAGAAGQLILLRNHELAATHTSLGPYFPGQSAPPQAYDAAELGGVTRVVVDAATGDRIASNLVLVGTARNCAGGLSPWGWLTCEETTAAGHGYVFVCSADATGVRKPKRIPAYGRFNHEAAAVDPATMIAYLTEDDGQSCFYRFLPDAPNRPYKGTLQAMRVVGADRLDLAVGHETGATWDIDWVDIASPDPSGTTVRAQGQAAGAAIVRRGEGHWLDGGLVYFCSTTGGPAGKGQIFCLAPAGDGGTLTLVAQSTSALELDMPDNLTVAPSGDLVLCEDGPGGNSLRVLHADGTISELARNVRSASELAGACFSPDGSLLFVNLQGDGLTLAIRGPF